MQQVLLALRVLKVFDHPFDILNPIFGHDQHCIRGLDNHGVLQTDSGYQARASMQITAVTVHIDDVTEADIALRVCLPDLP